MLAIREKIEHRMQVLSPAIIHTRLSDILLDSAANEALLLHATTCDAAELIAQQGFDDRLTHRALYG
jgi:hypothetical protein